MIILSIYHGICSVIKCTLKRTPWYYHAIVPRKKGVTIVHVQKNMVLSCYVFRKCGVMVVCLKIGEYHGTMSKNMVQPCCKY